MSAASIWSALRARFAAPEWAYLEEVRNGTGYSRGQVRTADALALSLWPSRGIELHGIEVKVSRGDWLREKGNPDKAEAIAQFCERWWLATTKGCVLDKSEIPTAWGWLEFDGKRLVQKVAASPIQAKPLDKLMIAGILRKATENQNAIVTQAVAAQLETTWGEEREKLTGIATDLREKLTEEQKRAQRAESLLHRLGHELGADLFEEGGFNRRPLPAVPEELREQLKLFRGAPLPELRERLLRAVSELRDAARWELRRAGIRPEPKRRETWPRRDKPAFFWLNRDDTSRDDTCSKAEKSAPEVAG